MISRAIALLLVVTFTFTASASVILVGNAVTLDSLEAGNDITVGDKLFTDFTYLATGADMPTSDNINVQGIIDCDGNFGIRFQGGFVDLPGNGASDALITFNVTALDPNKLISDAHLAANTDVVGDGLALITETFIPTFNDRDLTVFDNGTVSQLTDWVFFDDAPVRTLPVQKDILLLASDNGGVASAFSFIDQTFSQVPEPTSISLLLIAGLGFLGLRRK